jgi:hypothetical protein
MTTKAKASKTMYEYEGHEYTAKELIKFADDSSYYDRQDAGEGEGSITTLQEAMDYLEDVEIKKYEDGGLVSTMTVREYFASLNLDSLPADAAQYIRADIMSDPDMDLLNVDSEDLTEIKALIETRFQAAPTPAPEKPAEPAPVEVPAGGDMASKLRAEIADLTDVLDMGTDEETTKKIKQEISDLTDLLDLES